MRARTTGFYKLFVREGFTLISILITLALAGIFFASFGSHFRSSVRAESHFEIQSDLLDLRSFIANNLVCPVTCTPGSYVAITKVRTNPPTPLIKDFSLGTPSAYGLYLVRAFCSPCAPGAGCSNGKQLLFQYMRGTSATGPIADPLNGHGLTAAGAALWQDLFNAIPVGCPLS